MALLGGGVARAFNVQEMAARPTVKGVRHSILVYDLDRGLPLTAVADTEQLIPASNTKVLTALAALDMLGPNFRFETPFYLVPGPAGGPPTLFVALGADPTWRREFTPSVMDLLAPVFSALRKQGVSRLARVVVNDALLPSDGRPPEWEAEDLVWFYAPVASAATLEANAFELQIGPKCVGGKPQFTVYPAQRVVSLQNFMTCGGGSTATVSKVGRNAYKVTGSWRAGRVMKDRYSVDDPAVYLADALVMALSKAGFTFESGAMVTKSTVPGGAAEVARLRSAPLSAILTFMMNKSDNFTAETLFHLLGTRLSGTPGLEGARRGMALWLSRKGLSTVQWMDGSGLSRQNRMSARELGRAWLVAWQDPGLHMLVDTLAIAGQSGTLQRRFSSRDTSIARGRFRGKTGAMRGVSSLSGVLTTAKGKHLLVVSIQNGHQNGAAIRQWQDYLVAGLFRYN